jgi:hypothetical protein
MDKPARFLHQHDIAALRAVIAGDRSCRGEGSSCGVNDSGAPRRLHNVRFRGLPAVAAVESVSRLAAWHGRLVRKLLRLPQEGSTIN